MSGGGQKPICGIALWQRELLGDQHDLVGERCFSQGGAVAAVSYSDKLAGSRILPLASRRRSQFTVGVLFVLMVLD